MKLHRNPDIIWRRERRRTQKVEEALASGEDVSEDGVVTLIRAGMMHQLNLVGGRIWELCDGTKSTVEVVEALCSEYEAPPEEVAPDVEGFVADLLEKGWLTHG